MRALRGCCALVALVAGACYTVPSSDIAARYDTIYVPTLQNHTLELGLHTRVSEALRREFQNDGQLRLVNSAAEADLVLVGTLTGYRVRATAFDDDDNPVQFSIFVDGQVTVRDARTDATVWHKTITADEFYQVRRARGVRRARERAEGLDEAAEEFAERVVFDFVDSAW